MQLAGSGVWGPPADPDEAVRVLRRAVDLGVDFIDTADSYEPYDNEELIAEALYPYPADLAIATKAGLVRTGPSEWSPVGRPAYLRQQCEMSLRRLRVDRIDLMQLHRIDPEVSLEEQIGELGALRDEGKVRHIGVSEVTVDELEAARRIAPIASVQNRFNLVDRLSEGVLDHCEHEGLAFIPWFPIATGELARPGGVLDELARSHGATPAQMALAWLLQRSPVIVPIPGTSSVAHLEEYVAAALVHLGDDDVASMTNAA
ncbi:MAG: aldo/keto reductase [Acidimicrobiia bacterium]